MQLNLALYPNASPTIVQGFHRRQTKSTSQALYEANMPEKPVGKLEQGGVVFDDKSCTAACTMQ